MGLGLGVGVGIGIGIGIGLANPIPNQRTMTCRFSSASSCGRLLAPG